MNEQSELPNVFQVKLSHIHNDYDEDIQWLEISFKRIQFPEFEYSTLKALDASPQLSDMLRAAKDYFDKNPQSEPFKYTYGDNYKQAFMTKEEVLMQLDLILNRRIKSDRNKQFGEVIQLTQVISFIENYLLDSLRLLYHAFPDSLRTDKKITHSEVLECVSIEDVQRKLIDKEIHEISYKSIKQQLESISKTFNIQFNFSGDFLKELNEYKETRNIHMHNKGLIDREFMLKTGTINIYQVGSYKHLKNTILASNGKQYIERLYQVARHFNNGVYDVVNKKLDESDLGKIFAA